MNQEWYKKQTLLVISPHPDDGVIGCGGFIAKMKSFGAKVYVLSIALGDAFQYAGGSEVSKRIKEDKAAMRFLKVDDFETALIGEKYHLKLDSIPQKDIIDIIESKSRVSIKNVKPTIIAFPSICSENQDHIAVARAAFTACRPRPADVKPFPKIVISYEQMSSFWSFGQFKPDFFVDISHFIDKKMKALSFYKSQIPKNGLYPRTLKSLRNLAELRGATICCRAAESFESHRVVI